MDTLTISSLVEGIKGVGQIIGKLLQDRDNTIRDEGDSGEKGRLEEVCRILKKVAEKVTPCLKTVLHVAKSVSQLFI